MNCKLLHQAGGQRTFALILETGEETAEAVLAFARKEQLGAAQITGIGAFERVMLKYFDWEAKDYRDIPVNEQVEVASLIGDIGIGPDDAPALHIHLVVGKRDGTAMAGHLGSGHVRPTLELLVTESPSHLCRRPDPDTGLNLIRD